MYDRGCSLGSTIASCLAVCTDDKFSATLCAVVIYGLAAEHAARKDSVKGPGTFVSAFVDSLYELSHDQNILAKEIDAHSELLEFV